MIAQTVHLDGRTVGTELPLVLARLHWDRPVGADLELEVAGGPWSAEQLTDLVIGSGFDPGPVRGTGAERTGAVLRLSARRARALPDTVGADMRVLVCGLNPSVVAADAGYGYAGRSNRFWPAAMAAGLVTRRRDPLHALLADRVGMTDLVKRATPGASELTTEEYRSGMERVRRLVEWLVPDRVLFVGLAGWRAAADRGAGPGWQPACGRARLGAPVYVMPSTSGLNARTSLAELVAHMRAALLGP